MHVVFFHRRPTCIHFSLESIFDSVQKKLSFGISTNRWNSPCYSEGFIPRLRMSLAARSNQGDINHITGDIHFIAFALERKKTVLTIHDLGFLEGKDPLVRWVLKTFWITLPVKCVSKVTVVSEATKKQLMKISNVDSDKVRVIGNFVPDIFKPYLKPFDNSKPVILHIGSADNKNLERLIHALEGVICKLIIIGYPTEGQKTKLKKLNIEHEILSGLSQEELINRYKQCDLLSFVSLLEGFGLPILEAQSIGRPVVTSNLSSMPEVAGDAACYVDPFDISSIREGILKVIQDEIFRNGLISKGFENIKRFSLKTVAAQYESLYEEVYQDSKK